MKMIGSLAARVTALAGGGAKIIVLIIDQQFPAPVAYQNAQVAVLAAARNANVPVWAVLFNPSLGGDNPRATRQMDAALGQANQTFTKRTLAAFNADTQPNLRTALENAQIEWIVIMGTQSDQCVRLAAVGGPIDHQRKRFATGATALGYKILTCPQVQSTANVAWADQSKVTCYTQA